jgi:hypothetical protein
MLCGSIERRLKLEFRHSSVTSDAGLLTDRELDDALGLIGIAEQRLVGRRTSRNRRHDHGHAAPVGVRSACRI